MMVQMYSVSEFDTNMRVNFQLPADPYRSDEAVEYLKNLGVFFYRDQEHAAGIIIQQGDEPVEDTGNFLAHYFDVDLGPDGVPVSWDSPSSQIVSKNGDDKAWLFFNKQRVVHSFDHFSIRYS
jgi:hypothetical protein